MDNQKNNKDLLPDTGVGQEPVSELEVTTLLEEVVDKSRRLWAEVWAKAIRHERAYHGFSNETDRDAFQAESGIAAKNVMRTIVSANVARYNEELPQHRAFPTHPSASDSKAAELANRYLDWYRRDQEFGTRDYEFVQNSLLHGAGAWKVYWDVNGGEPVYVPKLDKNGAPEFDEDGYEVMEQVGYEGKVCADICTVFEFAYGPGHRVEDAIWCVFRRFVSKDEALMMLDEAGLDHMHLGMEKEYQTVSDGEAKGYEIWELWYRPGPRFPNGLYAKILGPGTVLFQGGFPYEHGELPIAVFHPDYVRDRCFGTSHVFDNYHLQRKLNLSEGKKDELMDRMAGIIMTVPEDLADEIEEGNLMVRVNDPQQANMISFKSVQQFPDMLITRSSEIERQMYDNGNVNEVLSGAENLKAGTSTSTYEFLSRASQTKMAGSLGRKRACDLRRDRLALKLFQQFAETERKVLVFGEDQEPYVEVFNGMTLEGTDVVMEAVPQGGNLRSQQAASAPAQAQEGRLAAGDVPEISRTGLQSTVGEAQARERIRALLQAGPLQGQQVEPDQTIPPLIAIDEIGRFRSLGQSVNEAMLQRFEQFYQSLLANQQQQGQPQ